MQTIEFHEKSHANWLCRRDARAIREASFLERIVILNAFGRAVLFEARFVLISVTCIRPCNRSTAYGINSRAIDPRSIVSTIRRRNRGGEGR